MGVTTLPLTYSLRVAAVQTTPRPPECFVLPNSMSLNRLTSETILGLREWERIWRSIFAAESKIQEHLTGYITNVKR